MDAAISLPASGATLGLLLTLSELKIAEVRPLEPKRSLDSETQFVIQAARLPVAGKVLRAGLD